MEGHLILSGHYQMSHPLGTTDKDFTVIITFSRYTWEAGVLWGTFDIVRSLSNVPDTQGKAGPIFVAI